ncbi:MAG: recombinase family protein [Candidatus Pacebacteria bacterium]|nr:recombinase family protein [Candidatus Paceibacterota bacterium]
MTKYFIYVRKSTDEPDKQILSIEAQVEELKEFARKENLEIVKTFIESQTAKEPGRPIFNEMLSLIEKGKASGILAWHPDRLARNSIDGGRIIYLIDTGKIQSLKFPTFWFENTPQGKFMLNIAFGQSKYFVDNLSENTKRGLRQKLRRGEWPGWAPIGYLNKEHKVIPDSERYKLIKKMFELYSTAKYSLKDLKELMASSGLRSRAEKVLSVSMIQHTLTNPFYYGTFFYHGELYQGTHKPIISKKLFDKVQEIMKDKSRPKKRGEKVYAFRGLFKCGECGCAITSETQKGHNYYRCTKKKVPCSQRFIREENLSEQISAILKKVSLPNKWKDKMIAILEKEQGETDRAGFSFSQNLKSQIKECEEKLEKLLDAHLDNDISREEYLEKKQKLLNRKIEISEKLTAFEKKGGNWLEPAKNFILASNQTQKAAISSNLQEKADKLKKAGSNLLLTDRKIKYFPRGAWEILENLPVSRLRRDEAARRKTRSKKRKI